VTGSDGIDSVKLGLLTAVAPTKVAFAHNRNSDVREFERFFGCPVEFGAPSNLLSGSSFSTSASTAERSVPGFTFRSLAAASQ
jgi:Arabinose-binding domain of AraC transcription regulator, N-term